MKINPVILKYHAENQPEMIFNTDALAGKLRHVKGVEVLGKAIAKAENAPVDMDLLSLCLWHHDDGRVKQMQVIGKFLDSELPHNSLGAERFNEFLSTQPGTVIDESIDIFRDVMTYHGREHLMSDSTTETVRRYVALVTAADNFENACSCVSYLKQEVANDEKGYIKANPEVNQLTVSPFVFEHFRLGVKFDKMKWCHTYGEYVIFAATLATNCIAKYGDIAKIALKQPGYGYSSILEGFKDVFESTLTPAMAKEAYEILVQMMG